MSEKLEDLLRSHCNLIDWNPTSEQLGKIKADIDSSLAAGKTLSKTECQNIVVKHCGSTRMFVTHGVDNSDLNTLLVIALSSIGDES